MSRKYLHKIFLMRGYPGNQIKKIIKNFLDARGNTGYAEDPGKHRGLSGCEGESSKSRFS